MPKERLKRRMLGRLGWRIVLLAVGCVVVTTSVLGLLVHQMVGMMEDGRVRDRAAAALASAGDLYAEVGVLPSQARLDDATLPTDVRSAATDSVVTFVRGGGGEPTTVVAAGPMTVDGLRRVLSVSADASDLDAARASIDGVLVAAGLATALFLATIAGVTAAGLTRRLETAAGASLELAVDRGGGHGVRSALGGRPRHPDEVDRLAESIDAMAAQLHSRLEAEQRFTADLAHELRTPLAGMLMASDLLDDSRPAQLVRDRTQRLRVLVEDLLEVSRLEAGVTPVLAEPIDLGSAVHAAVKRAVAEGVPGADAVQWEYEGSGGTVMLEQRRLDRVISNLLKNAAAHGAAPVTLRVSSAQVSVTDSGSGFPAAILDAGPSRFVSRGGGWGLGLTIARAQAEQQDIGFWLSNAPGARITLVFPPSGS